MNPIFTGLLDNGVLIHLNEVLIFFKTQAEHIALVRKTFKKLRANKLYGNVEKTLWFQEAVEFLGYIL